MKKYIINIYIILSKYIFYKLKLNYIKKSKNLIHK